MTGIPENPNLNRRAGPGLLVAFAAPFLKPLLRVFRRPLPGRSPLTVFQSYMIGDLFMALPAVKLLALEFEVRVVCRPDCLKILRSEGLKGIPFDNIFFSRPGFASFLRTFRSAWKLRGSLGACALDFDADPRTAFWLRIAGATRVVSYRRSRAVFFDELFPLPAGAIHQSDKDRSVASGFLDRCAHSSVNTEILPAEKTGFLESLPRSFAATPSDFWIVSCWTRKDTKNWPLDRWDAFLKKMTASGMRFQILDAPDGDAAFRTFQTRWAAQAEMLTGSLTQIAAQVRASRGVVATDNFIGHLGAYYGRPVLWINGSSDPHQVMPKGISTASVQADPMPCRPCGHRCINADYKACLTTLDVDAVWRAFEKMREENY